VSVILRLLALPSTEVVFPFVCAPRLRDVASRVGTMLGRAGLRSTPAREEMWRSYASLTDAESRHAFFRGLRDVIDWRGQAVSALGRLHHTAKLPTLIIWGARDPFIPVSHARVAHEAIPGSRLVIFEGVGHYPHCEAPERFVETIVDFIASTEPARLPMRSPNRHS
jgi:pimeloyl-ACP methyl ester carboxylesterase